MKTFNTTNFWTNAGLLVTSLFDEKTTITENSWNGQPFDASCQDSSDLDSLAFYSIQQTEFEHDCELENWPEEEMESLFYEMSVEVNPGILAA
jgi:hypothetical protein